MSDFPNMLPEVLEAIEEYFKNDEDVLTDCWLYLESLADDKKKVNQLVVNAENKLYDMGRCPNCGSPMQTYKYLEPHTELDGCPMEEMYEKYCPDCDTPHQMNIKEVVD